MSGKQYGDQQPRSNALQALIGMVVPVDLITMGEIGQDLQTFATPDGGEHSGGEVKAIDVPFTMDLTDAAQVQFMEAWWAECQVPTPTYKRPCQFNTLGPGDVIASSTFVEKVFIKSFKRSGHDRNTAGALTASGVFSMSGNIKNVIG